MDLNHDEQTWLEEYRQALQKNYPGLVEDMVVFDAEEGRFLIPEYTVNVVVILKKHDRQTGKDVDFLGHRLAVLSDAIPFVWVYSQDEWKHRRQDGSLPYRGDGISVWHNKT